MIELELTPDGGIRMLHDDLIDLRQFGKLEILRASQVEYSDGNPPALFGLNRFPKVEGWFVRSENTGIILKAGFLTRVGALAWEKQYYSPGGQGWKELTEKP